MANTNYVKELKRIRAKFARRVVKLKAQENEEIEKCFDAIKFRNERIRQCYSNGCTYAFLAREFGLSPGRVGQIIKKGILHDS